MKILTYTNEWIENNIDDLYEQFVRTGKKKTEEQRAMGSLRQINNRTTNQDNKNMSRKEYADWFEKQELK